jgi:hypothetical protein
MAYDAPDRAQLRLLQDSIDYGVFSGEWCIGRIYEHRSGPEELRWFWGEAGERGGAGACGCGAKEGAQSALAAERG